MLLVLPVATVPVAMLTVLPAVLALAIATVGAPAPLARSSDWAADDEPRVRIALPLLLPMVTAASLVPPISIEPLAVVPLPASMLTPPPVVVVPVVAVPPTIWTVPPVALVAPVSVPPWSTRLPPTLVAVLELPGWTVILLAVPAAVVVMSDAWLPWRVMAPALDTAKFGALIRLVKVPLKLRPLVAVLAVEAMVMPLAAPPWLTFRALAAVPVVPLTVKATMLLVVGAIISSLAVPTPVLLVGTWTK